MFPSTTLSMLRSAVWGEFCAASDEVCGWALLGASIGGRGAVPFSVDVLRGAAPLDATPSLPPGGCVVGPLAGVGGNLRVVWVYLGPDDAPLSVAAGPLTAAVPLVCFLVAAGATCRPRRVFGALGCVEDALGSAVSFAGGSGAGFGV